MLFWRQICQTTRTGAHQSIVGQVICGKFPPRATQWHRFSTTRKTDILDSLRPWTQADQDELIRLKESDLPFPDIAKLLGRSRRAVQGRYHGLRDGRISPQVSRSLMPWTPKEDAILTEARSRGKTMMHISENLLPHRSTSSIQNRSSRLHCSQQGFHRQSQRQAFVMPHRPWTREEDETLRRMSAEGRRLDGIALALKRDYGSVKSRHHKVVFNGEQTSYEVHYTPEEEKILLEARKAGMKFADIQRLLPNRKPSCMSVKHQALLMQERKSPSFNSGRTWSEDDIEDLRVLRLERKLPLRKIAVQMARSYASVAYACGEYLEIRKPARVRWTEGEVALLDELRKKKMTWKKISQAIGRSVSSCRAKWEDDLKGGLAGTVPS